MRHWLRMGVALSMVLVAPRAGAESKALPTGAFEFTFALTLPGTPEEIFDAATGDVSGWWDHTFSKPPKRLYIEPKPGGGFYEIFDDSGNGVRHAVVTYAHRGKLLRMEGPLGLTGNAITGVYSYQFTAAGADSTTLAFTCRMAGQVEPGWDAVVEQVWRHFLIGRFQPYVLSGAHKQKK